MYEPVCSVKDYDNAPPKKYAHSVVCPDGCKEYSMLDIFNHEKNSTLSMFTLEQDGRTLSVKKTLAYSKVNEISVFHFMRMDNYRLIIKSI